jgi:hypothetical protein
MSIVKQPLKYESEICRETGKFSYMHMYGFTTSTVTRRKYWWYKKELFFPWPVPAESLALLSPKIVLNLKIEIFVIEEQTYLFHCLPTFFGKLVASEMGLVRTNFVMTDQFHASSLRQEQVRTFFLSLCFFNLDASYDEISIATRKVVGLLMYQYRNRNS